MVSSRKSHYLGMLKQNMKFVSSLFVHRRLFPIFFVFSCFFLISPEVFAKGKVRFDIIYLLSNDLERVLDYKEELEPLFDDRVRKRLRIVGRAKEYALIYDCNATGKSIVKILVEHGDILSRAGFDEPYSTKEQNFHCLYNVSYGIGPNLEPLKKLYGKIHKYLGPAVRKDLFIERTDYGNYTLIYRYRGWMSKTNKVAKKHGKILKRKRIKTSVTRENNNEIVYGESSFMNDSSELKSNSHNKSKKANSPAKKLVAKKEAKAKKIVKNGATKNKKKEIIVSAVTGKGFEKSIEEYIDKLRRKGRIKRDESTGWMVYDLEKDQSLVDINADQEFQAASMIKPFVALAFFHQVKNKKFKYGPRSRRKMVAMIQRSSNSATNWVMRQAGGPKKCESILKKYYSHIFKKTEIKEYIPANGRTYLNSSPPSDYVRFLRALWNKELPYGKEIRRLMALPGRDRLYHGTPIPRGTLVYNKTGSTAHLCGDMGILVPKTKKGGRYPYVIVGIIEKRSRPSNYGRWMDSRSRVIREVSTMVYKKMRKDHKLR